MKRSILAGLPLLGACALVLLLPGQEAEGYTSIRSPSGNALGLPVRWDLGNGSGLPNVANRRVRYEIYDQGCKDASGFTGPVDEFEAIQNSFSVWRRIEESELDFEFAGVTSSGSINGNDNRNLIRWVDSGLSAGVYAVTITTFDTNTGEIVDADMELNDPYFTWDTVGENASSGPVGRAVVETIVTHEIGHFVGLDHPPVQAATLYYSADPGQIDQISLEADDRSQIIADYPHSSLSDPRLGTVSGSVTDGSTARFGVHVVLVDIATGRNVISHLSEKDTSTTTLGQFTIENVPPGNYLAMAVPAETSTLGSFYSTAYTSFFPVVRGVSVGAVGAPTLVKLEPGGAVSGVTITLPSASQDPFEDDDTSGTATALTSGQAGVAKISPAAEVDYYSFSVAAGQTAMIRVLADGFGSSLNPTLTLLDTNGSTVLASPVSFHPNYMASANDIDSTAYDTTGVNYDAEVEYTFPGAGTYFFAVASRAGVTSGEYLVSLEIEGADVTQDAVLSSISADTTGVPADGSTTFDVTVNPKNAFGRTIGAPTTFTVELIDRTNGDAVLDTITAQSTPFVFTVTALSSSSQIEYGARIGGVDIAETVTVSHYGTLSFTNSRIVLPETSLVANGGDRCEVRILLRDTSNNPYTNTGTTVTVNTTRGTLDNGSTTGTSGVAATFDAARGWWVLDLVSGTSTGGAVVSAYANSSQVDSKSITFTAKADESLRATSTSSDDGGKDDDGGGCTAGAVESPVWLALALLLTAAAWRRRRRDHGRV